MKQNRVSAIIPVGRGESRVARCLEHLTRLAPPVDEIVLVCDGANHLARQAGERYGARIVQLPRRLGPANARNQGALAARGEVLLFVDADVLVPPNLVTEILQVLDPGERVVACFGSYDDAPAEPNFLSQYKNLFHHYVHQHSSLEASTFWTGCGAIFSDVFREAGGFDEEFALPSVEDIDFGYRLRDAGYRIRLVPTLQVKHLKRWEAFSLLRTDFFLRAVPWGRLMLSRKTIPNELNLKVSGRLSGLAVLLLAGALPLAAWYWPAGLGLALVASLSLVLLNFPLYRFFRRERGWLFLLGAVVWNWFYYLYGTLGFGVALAVHLLDRCKPRARPAEDERIGAELPLE